MATIIQRPLRGSRISTFYPVKNLPSLASLDSAFQLQEYISLLIRLDVHDVDSIVSLPGSSAKDTGKEKETEAPEDNKVTQDKDGEKTKDGVTVDEACWIYEQLRRLAQDLTHPLITTLQQECTRASCPEMKAGEWLYLCVAHGNEGSMEQCCAIDYILHTLDSATALLNSPRAFPSRLQIPATSHRHFSSLARRLGRIFAHAYFHHREAFEQAEAESSLYARFLALTSKFDLVPSEFLVIPPEAFQGGGYGDDHGEGPGRNVQPPRLHAAALDPQGDRERQRGHYQPSQSHSTSQAQQRQPSPHHQLGVTRTTSASPPEGSPRRFGRNRTDTMIFSEAEASIVAEELAARSANVPEDLSLSNESAVEDEFEAGPKTAKPTLESRVEDELEEEDEKEGDSGIEIQLTPDEVTLSPQEEVAVETKVSAEPAVPKEVEEVEEATVATTSTEAESQPQAHVEAESAASVVVDDKPKVEEGVTASDSSPTPLISGDSVVGDKPDTAKEAEPKVEETQPPATSTTVTKEEEAPAAEALIESDLVTKPVQVEEPPSSESTSATLAPSSNESEESSPVVPESIPTSAKEEVIDTPQTSTSETSETPAASVAASAVSSTPTAEASSTTDSETAPTAAPQADADVVKEAPSEGA